MRQVPEYLLIGDGRVSRHFQHYFSQLSLRYRVWYRQEPIEKLTQKLAEATHILLLISDDAIVEFAETYLQNSPAIKIHFSGSLISDQIYGAHPLMSFTDQLYDQYQTIPFIIDHDAPEFVNLLPGLPNRHVRLHKSLKAKYHALCVLSGNFSCMLWQKLLTSFENELHLSPEIAHAYLLQQTQNLLSDYKSALTGPLVRNDIKTLQNNLQALNADPFQQIYQSFISCYAELKKGVTHEYF